MGTAFEDLERLIDEQTPYFKARIEELPVQARKVFHCLAERWTPMLARELSVAAKLSSSHASAQLRQLVEKGYAREVRIQREKRVRYEVGDRFYNIYYLLRFSRTGRGRLERLVAFQQDLFGSTGMRSMYPATRKALRGHTLSTGDVSENVDPAYGEAWRVQAAAVLARNDDARLAEAEDYARRAVELEPEDSGALCTLSDVLTRRGNWSNALELLERAVHLGNDCGNSNRPGLPETLIKFVAAGYGVSVKRLMERNTHLAETMEPLWHAVRAALGEELEPLPAEIMDTVTEIRQKFGEDRS